MPPPGTSAVTADSARSTISEGASSTTVTSVRFVSFTNTSIEKSPDGRGAPTGLTAPTVRGRVRRTRAPRRTHAKRRPGAAVLATAEKSKK